ncbi:MAG: ATP-binding protein [Sphaerochaetaceae bacterium]
MKLKSQQAIVVSALLLLLGLLAFITADQSFRYVSGLLNEETLHKHSEFLKETFENEGSWDARTLDRYANAHQIRLTVIAADGTVLYDSKEDPGTMDNHAYRKEVKEALQTGSGDDSRQSATVGVNTIYHAERLPLSPPVVLRVGLEQQSVLVWRKVFASRLSLILVAAIIVSLAVSLLLMERISRPLQHIAEVAKSYGNGQLGRRIWIDGPDEIKMVGSTLQSMAEQLSTQMNRLETDRSRFSTILETMAEAVILVDTKKQVILSNGEATRRFGTGKTLMELIPDSDLLTLCGDILESNEAGSCTVKTEKAILQASIAPIHMEGTVTGAVITLSDITNLKHLEQVRKDFVANVSHELKSPLTSILGFSDILTNKNLSEEERIKFAAIVKTNSERMMGIIQDLLTLASLERDETTIPMQPCPVGIIIDETLMASSYKAQQKSITLVVENACPPDARVYCAKALLIQALLNLVINAVLYSPEQTVVTLRASETDRMISFAVVDHGYGIAKEDQERIFERFYRVDKARSRSVGGTGLGLSIVRHVAMIHKGTITVESKLGVGSTFTFTLPRDGEIGTLQQKSDRMLNPQFN